MQLLSSLALRTLSLQRFWKITGIEYFKNKKEEEERQTLEEEEEEAFNFGRDTVLKRMFQKYPKRDTVLKPKV